MIYFDSKLLLQAKRSAGTEQKKLVLQFKVYSPPENSPPHVFL